MTKTPVQQMLEAQRGKDIKDILTETLTKFRGRRYISQLVSAELHISDATFYNWCAQWQINIDHYRFPGDLDSSEPDDNHVTSSR